MLERDILGQPAIPAETRLQLHHFDVQATYAPVREMWPFDGIRRRRLERRGTTQRSEEKGAWIEDVSDILGSIVEPLVDTAVCAGSKVANVCESITQSTGDWGGGSGGGDSGGGGCDGGGGGC